MKKVIVLVAVMMFVGGCRKDADTRPYNPAYKQWSAFKAGAMVKTVTKTTTKTPEGDVASSVETTKTLKEVKVDNKVILTISSVTEMGGKKTPPLVSEIEISAKVEPKPTTQQAGQEKKDSKDSKDVKPDDLVFSEDLVEVGAEDVEVAGVKYPCKIFQIQKEKDGVKVLAKLWTNTDIPGGIVKSEVTMDGKASSKSTTIMTEFKAEK